MQSRPSRRGESSLIPWGMLRTLDEIRSPSQVPHIRPLVNLEPHSEELSVLVVFPWYAMVELALAV
jgi:hypothetical protein